ncbi:hydantoinase/oxoprolinase family protein [Roseomonas frigidaquae]|uniref:Hydantoinase/oxoprolinase family protein n=1 Tax=Falsiroseomonas frigidaquae TaxID=487318 RepID=A0ABX1EU73_9PROT|nr:hydantoinase/oxoprolinase family protein [Falsiroseomonas frigidaquae]NKE44098.1 hydantoinase/oxoprolinase family protein [Falsiroseomonas frigidaquae]
MSLTETRPLSVAVDIGGTFTDITLQDGATGRAWTAKTPSTPHDPSEAFLTGVRLALENAGESAARIGRVLHGTTIATNLILENKGATTALVTTKGFRHVLEIGRQDIPRRANLHAWVKPRRPVPPSRVFEVTERVAADGTVLLTLDEASVQRAAEACRQAGVAAVAICLLHAFTAPAHERRVAELLRAALPGVAVTASVDVLPVVREYERSLAAILNAQVMPAVSTYVRRLEERLAEDAIEAPLLLMKSNGGVAGAASIRRAPAVTALSGPAAGVVGARAMAEAAGVPRILTVDIGGTSADICLMQGGAINLTQRGSVGDWPLPLPMLDMVTIGAGGGSIARVTAEGALAVGPESAGANPGPACYGRGGQRATVTDAHVVLGHLPTALLGGRMHLDAAAAEAVVRREVAEPLNLSLHEAARGILAVVDSNMVGALRVVSVERGHDPRDFTLVPFGGAGPLHGCALAAMIGIDQVLVPPSPGVLCAQGLLSADLRAEFSRSVLPGRADVAAIEAGFEALLAEAEAWFLEEAVPPAARRTARVVLMRYAGQGGELPVPWHGADAAADFAAAHRALYGFDLPKGQAEIVTLRLEAVGALPPPHLATLPPGRGAQPHATQTVHFESGTAQAALYDRAVLGQGDTLHGPAIVTQLDATTLIPPGWTAEVLAHGAMLLRRS